MGWKPGEVWLDTDALWLGEGAGAPSLTGAVPAAGLGPRPAPGLLASRRRREEWRQRRNARKARAAALALSPAAIIPLAALRGGGGPEKTTLVDDPPTLAFRPGPGLGDARHRSPASRPRRVERRVARAAEFPTIAWHRATSVGLPYRGSLVDGTQLPLEGPDWVTWNPVTDSVPNAPHRLYGNEHTIRAILSVTRRYRAAHPKAPRVVIGDISRERGGPMTDEHVSHQNGLDVDVYYPRLDRALRAPVEPGEVDRRLAQDLVDRFVAAGAQMVFVGYSAGLHGPPGVVIPYASHEIHMHVRFPQPRGEE
jgi:Penicillin-insensitive murein endopeptidase